MSSSPAVQPGPSPSAGVGSLLRHWRETRRLSQLALALNAGISTRHLSYVETGRARPSQDMLLRLAEALQVPLRERNVLLLAGGYAPLYGHSTFDTPGLGEARNAVAMILAKHDPYPAFVLDRHWNILMRNTGLQHFLARFPDCAYLQPANAIRLIFHPRGLRPFVQNWEAVASRLIQRVHREAAANPFDELMRNFLAELLNYPGVPDRWRTLDLNGPPPPLLSIDFQHRGATLRLFSTITTFGTPQDVALQELRIECLFPADDATRAALVNGSQYKE